VDKVHRKRVRSNLPDNRNHFVSGCICRRYDNLDTWIRSLHRTDLVRSLINQFIFRKSKKYIRCPWNTLTSKWNLALQPKQFDTGRFLGFIVIGIIHCTQDGGIFKLGFGKSIMSHVVITDTIVQNYRCWMPIKIYDNYSQVFCHF